MSELNPVSPLENRPEHTKFLGILIFYFLLLYGWLTVFSPTWIPPLLRVGLPSEPMNILILGMDRSYAGHTFLKNAAGRSDTIILVHFNPYTTKINLLSIPRDTIVRIPDGGWQKANAALALGGPSLAMDTFSKFLGVPVNHYIIVSLDSFEHMVNAIGGVRIYVDRPMHYTDHAGHLDINLDEGWQTLYGHEAHEFIRFRHEAMGDIARAQRQQRFMTAFFGQLTSWRGMLGLPGVFLALGRDLQTNVSLGDLARMANMCRMLPRHDIQMILLPGEAAPNPDLGSTWVPDLEKKAEIVNTYFSWPTHNGGHPLAVASRRVAIINASSRSEAVQEANAVLQKNNYFITSTQIVTRPDYRQSRILIQKGDREGGEQLAKLLEIGRADVQSTGDISADFTVILGADWHPPH